METLQSLLAQHAKDPSDILLENILALLQTSKVWVPGIDARTKDTFPAIHEQNLLHKLDMPLLPDLLKAPDGNSFYGAFTDKDQAPEDYRNYFQWIELPFLELCAFAANSEITSNIILNPFTTPLALPVTLVIQYAGQYEKSETH